MPELSDASEARKLAVTRRPLVADKASSGRPLQAPPLIALHKDVGNRRISRALTHADGEAQREPS